LRVTIWYPASKDSVEQPLAVGPPDKPLFEVGLVAFDAPFADGGPRPILLLAPGGGASARMVGWFGIAMARAGYVVIAVDHPGDNGDDVKTTAAMLLAWVTLSRFGVRCSTAHSLVCASTRPTTDGSKPCTTSDPRIHIRPMTPIATAKSRAPIPAMTLPPC